MYIKDVENTDLKKARQSIVEEIEAIDYYETRIAETKDAALKKILIHNLREEKEHTAMLMEWVRKNDSEQDKAFKEHD